MLRRRLEHRKHGLGLLFPLSVRLLSLITALLLFVRRDRRVRRGGYGRLVRHLDHLRERRVVSGR